MTTFRNKPGFTTTDGHHYVSIPTHVPNGWHRWTDEHGVLHYGFIDYLIVRETHFGARPLYRLSRDVDGKSVNLGIGAFTRLRDAQAYARLNARGADVFNWA